MTELIPFDIVFRHPERLWSIGVVALIFIALVAVKYCAARRAFKVPWVKDHLRDAKVPSLAGYVITGCLLLSAASFLALVWAEPERRIIAKNPIYGRVRVAFLIDSSLSMVYADDIRPTRLVAAKKAISEFVELLGTDKALQGEYSLALIPFAGASLPTYSLFTTSKSEILWLLENVNERTITRQGTSFLAALRGYKVLLERSPTPDPLVADLAIIISDGGKEEGIQSERNPITHLLKGFSSRTFFFTVGVGTKEIDEGCVLRERARTHGLKTDSCERMKPVPLAEKDENGLFKGYLRERPNDPGSPVLKSELDESLLKLIATPTEEDTLNTKKNYRFFTERKEILGSFKTFVLANRRQVGTNKEYRYEPMLEWFLLPAFVIIYFLFGFGGWIRRSIRFAHTRLR